MAAQRLKLDKGRQSNSTQLYGVNCATMRFSFPLQEKKDQTMYLPFAKRRDLEDIRVGLNCPETSPVIRPDLKVLQCDHSQNDPSAVTDQCIHDPLQKKCKVAVTPSVKAMCDKVSYMIPPALAEVRQLVFQRVLQQLEHNANHSAQPPVAQNERLQPPSEEKEEYETKLIKDGNVKNKPPDDRVWSTERTIAGCHYAEHQKHHHHGQDAPMSEQDSDHILPNM
ncbi:hypothetical protein RvY_09083 [Ramazzottius varieornatus]|uniref:Uncharacterized protein n=1 Tax=Ramazzottius varieornatus TaxID=947166 RepID=A0A1D1V885_RAMVA|nr:hypothetical protein RvY_09083 [Ramazzottius varieornatus]